ncbi:MAG: choice-of-anchor P family protein [Actinomycetota bacterium]
MGLVGVSLLSLHLFVTGESAAAVPGLGSGTVSGSAFGESVDATVLGIHLTSGPMPSVTLPPVGGNSSSNLSSACVGADCGVLSAGVLRVSTRGSMSPSPRSTSAASVASVNVLAGMVSADLVTSTCSATGSGVSGSAGLARATVAGAAVGAAPGPNTTIGLAGGATLILNEQTKLSSGGTNRIIVNAIHIILAGGEASHGDIIVAQSECDTAAGAVVPVGTIGVLGLTAAVGLMFAFLQYRSRRRRGGLSAQPESLQ